DKPKSLELVPRPHWELGESLGILDIPRGTKLSGSRFYVLRGAGAAMQRALIAWMIDLKIAAGFTEIYPPFVTRRETLTGSAHLPHFDENLYRDEDDDIWLVPTAEPQLVGLHRDETLEIASLPRRYVAYTACFRREHMSAGRDVRGIKRGHEFDKVEMVVHCTPEDSEAWLDKMTALAVEGLETREQTARRRGPREARAARAGQRAVHRRSRIHRDAWFRRRRVGAGRERVARGLIGVEMWGGTVRALEQPRPYGGPWKAQHD